MLILAISYTLCAGQEGHFVGWEAGEGGGLWFSPEKKGKSLPLLLISLGVGDVCVCVCMDLIKVVPMWEIWEMGATSGKHYGDAVSILFLVFFSSLLSDKATVPKV